MSTYTYRYIEVRREMVDGSVWKKENLPSPEKHEGEIYRINDNFRPEDVAPYYKATALISNDKIKVHAWMPLESVEKKWVPLKWYSYLPKNKVVDNADPYYKPKYHVAKDADGNEFFIEEHIYWVNNGGHIRDDYISSRGFGSKMFAGRGLPEDVSEEVKNDISSDYAYDKTWVTLDEWEKAFDAAKEKFKNAVCERCNEKGMDEISEKLDTILKTLKNADYKPEKKKGDEDDDTFEYEDSVDYLFDEDIWELINIQTEIDRISFILDDFSTTWHGNQDVRIIYHLA